MKELNLTYDFVDIAQLQTQQIDHVDDWAKIVVNKNPKLVAFSIFSYHGQPYAKELATKIKSLNAKISIIIGGKGIKDSLNTNELTFVNQLLNEKLIDYYHDGDSEQAWPDFLINFFNLTHALPVKYYSDFSKHDVNYYRQQARINDTPLLIPVTSSYGCVRKCTFCDIHQHWKFTQKNPDDMAREIKASLKYIPDGHITFTDSLVNGNIPSFLKLLDNLIEIKNEYPNMSWTGQIIVRNEKTASEEYWKKISQSGAREIQMGIETGSDRLRADMRKNFTNDDLHKTLLYMEKFKITCCFLILVGYPTETDTDFKETVDMLYKYKHYAGNVIQGLQLGHIMTINPGTPVYDQSINDPDMILSNDIKIWFNKKNPTLTFDERIRRRNELEKIAIELGYKLAFDNHTYKEENIHTAIKYQKIINLMEKKAVKNLVN
jgi:radical SAM superfamily enzyme YgiQ (UPF0313 family)